MPATRLFVEDAALLKETLAEVLREEPPATLSDFEHLEYAVEVAADLLDGLRRDGSSEATALTGSLSRLVEALQRVRHDALSDPELRSEATRAVLSRFSLDTVDSSVVAVAVGSPFALQLDLRFLVESRAIGTSGRGILTAAPRWLAELLGRDVHRVAAAETFDVAAVLAEREALETALALWEPSDPDSEYALFSSAFLAAGLLVRR